MMVADENDLADAIGFVMMVLAVPAFLLVFVTTLIVLSPVLLPAWLWRRHFSA